MVRLLLEVTRAPLERAAVDTRRPADSKTGRRDWRKPVLTHHPGNPADTR